jgi:predicted O-methyltransferase YrrM
MSARFRNHLAPFFAPLRLCGKHFSTPRARNDYATHVPILIGLARMREMRSVLEFGCGYFSTLTFLNRAAFPHLQRLHTVENDVSWSETINEVAKTDARWTLQLVKGEIAGSVPKLDLESFDLILIDDSKTSAQRAATIRAVAQAQPQHPWIAIHDFEVNAYQQAGSGFRQRRRFKAYNPETGLLSNNAINTRALARLLKDNAKTLQPDDVNAWIRTHV